VLAAGRAFPRPPGWYWGPSLIAALPLAAAPDARLIRSAGGLGVVTRPLRVACLSLGFSLHVFLSSAMNSSSGLVDLRAAPLAMRKRAALSTSLGCDPGGLILLRIPRAQVWRTWYGLAAVCGPRSPPSARPGLRPRLKMARLKTIRFSTTARCPSGRSPARAGLALLLAGEDIHVCRPFMRIVLEHG